MTAAITNATLGPQDIRECGMDTKLKCLSGPKQYWLLFRQTTKAMMGLGKLPSDQRITKQLGEKISLAVSGVNNCRYCSWLHTKTALEKGLSQDEVDAMLSADFGNLAPYEAAAILYAQHWADRDGKVAAEAREKILAEYGPNRTTEIEALLWAVHFGNLCSNTVVTYRDTKNDKRRPVSRFTYLLALPVAGAIKRRSGIKGE